MNKDGLTPSARRAATALPEERGDDPAAELKALAASREADRQAVVLMLRRDGDAALQQVQFAAYALMETMRTVGICPTTRECLTRIINEAVTGRAALARELEAE